MSTTQHSAARPNGPRISTAIRTWRRENALRQMVRFGCVTLTGRRLIQGRINDTLASYFVGVRVGRRGYGVTVPCRRRPCDPSPIDQRVTWTGSDSYVEVRKALGFAYGGNTNGVAGPALLWVRTPDGESAFPAPTTFVHTLRGWEVAP